MVLLTSTTNSFEAQVIHAHLQAEGLDPELRGSVDGSPYRLTVGDMANVSIFVPDDQLDDARLVLLATEVDAATSGDGDDTLLPVGRNVVAVAMVLALLLVVGVVRVAFGV